MTEEKLFYRVHHPRELGLWYNDKGEFTHEIGKLELNVADLEMDKNEECDGNFLSCTHSLDSLFDWFSRKELFKLKDAGYDICIFKSDNFKFHEKYKHFLFQRKGSLLVAKINII